MGEFFHGWRRKIGLLTLVMALVLLVAMIWSDSDEQKLKLTIDSTIGSATVGAVVWRRVVFAAFGVNGRDIPFLACHIFWLIIPLTLVSAFLLLSKPRKSTQTKLTEPIPEKGA